MHEEKNQDANQSSMGVRAPITNYVIVSSPKATKKRWDWVQHPTGVIKLDVDASFDHNLFGGMASAILDHPSQHYSGIPLTREVSSVT